jgi:hypothetical protein
MAPAGDGTGAARAAKRYRPRKNVDDQFVSSIPQSPGSHGEAGTLSDAYRQVVDRVENNRAKV